MQSGGTSGDLAIEGYRPKTPVVPYVPDSDPATAIIASNEPDDRAFEGALDRSADTKRQVLTDLLTSAIPSLLSGEDDEPDTFRGYTMIAQGKDKAQEELVKAVEELQKSRQPSYQGLTPEERTVAPFAVKAHKEFPDIPASLLMSLTRQESGFDPNAVSSAGARGLTQFMPETAPGYDVEYGDSPKAMQSQLTGAADLLSSNDFAKNPKGALEIYTGGSIGSGYSDEQYNNPVLQGAQDYIQLDRGGKPSKQARARVQQAKEKALSIGVSPKQVGDIVETRTVKDKDGTEVPMVKIKANAQGMKDWSESQLGQVEGDPKTMRWGEKFGLNPVTEPWCANFVSNGLIRRGIDPSILPSNPNYVPTYEDEWGQYSVGNDLAKAKPGDLLAFNGAHIGVYIGDGEMISGNSSDEVARTPATHSAGLSMIIRPPYPGGTIEVPAGQANMNPIPVPPEAAVASSSPGSVSINGSEALTQAARERLGQEPESLDRGSQIESILDLLSSPVPSVDDPRKILEDEDELFKLALMGRG